MKVWIIILLLIPLANAATIQGSVYDFSFEPEDAIVEINTTPVQRIVAIPSYSFQVPKGNYEIKAMKKTGDVVEASATEQIVVNEDGLFTLDIILFPELDIEESLNIDEPVVKPEELEYLETKRNPLDAFIFLLILLFAYIIHKSTQKNKLNLEEDALLLYKFITRKKRTTQKEIRKEFHHSEAKISLIITELEEKGLVKKIKKGRGNVIIKI